MSAPTSEGPIVGQPPSRSRSPFAVGFRTPEPEPAATIPSPSPHAETIDPDSPPASAVDSGSDEPSDESGPAATGSPASATRVANPLVGTALRDTFRNGVIIAGDQAHRFLARTQGQLEAGVYKTDEEDAANIGDPLSRIAARREGLGTVSPDTADLLAAMMGLAGYASKQIVRQQIAAKHDAGAAAAGVQTLPSPEDLA